MFGTHMNHFGFKVGIEVGVSLGDFAATTLRQWRLCEKYILIDPYRLMPNYVDQYTKSEQAMDEMYEKAKSKLAEFGSVPVWMRMTSKAAAALIPDSTADFIYLDAQHNYCSVLEDLQLYWPKLKVGGVMSGHDYVTNTEMQALMPGSGFDWSRCDDGTVHESAVKGAILDFARSQGVDVSEVYSTGDTHTMKSWAFWKNESQV